MTPVTYAQRPETLTRPGQHSDPRFRRGEVSQVFRDHLAVLSARIAWAKETNDQHEEAIANIERLNTLALANRLGLNVESEE